MEDNYSIERPRITKLSGPNYRPWSIQVQRLLLGYNLWTVVDLGVKDDISGEEDPKEDRTMVKDAKASTIIMGLCSSGALQHILLLNSAKEQWGALKALYSPLGLQQLSAKVQAFTGYKPPEKTTSIAEISTQLSTLQYEIGAIDPKERPSDTLKISILLQAVRIFDNRFAPLILQLEISNLVTEYSTVIAHLTEGERRMGPKDPLKETAFSANIGAKGNKRTFQGDCYNCGKKGHRATDCRSKKPEKRTGKGPERLEKGPSTGPLATPGGGRGLSPGPNLPSQEANSATETSWMALTERSEEAELLWVIDSGCSRHMTYSKEAFIEYHLLEEPIAVNTASGTRIQAIAEGVVSLKVAIEGTERTVALNRVLHVPKLAGNLISVLQLQDRGITVRTTIGPEGNRLLIEYQGAIIGIADRIGRTYTLNCSTKKSHIGYIALKTTTEEPERSRLWHRRFGHLSTASLKNEHTVTTGISEPISAQIGHCEACSLTKTVRVVNRKEPERAREPLQRIHTDFWGPFKVPTLDGDTYMLTFTDDYTRKAWVYLTKGRDRLRALFLQFKVYVELQIGKKIRAVRCDNAPEYRALGAQMLQDQGIQFEFTTAYTPEQNGVSERLNRTLTTLAKAMLLEAGLPSLFWGEAVLTACYLRNRTPIGPEGKTPEEAFSGKKPGIGHLRVFGCLAYAHVPFETRDKMAPTAIRTCLIGYMPTARQYRLYDPKRAKVIVSTAPNFKEDRYLDWNWNEIVVGEETTPFDPMEPDFGTDRLEEPESHDSVQEEHPITIGDKGSEDETIIVDTGNDSPEIEEDLGPRRSGRERKAPKKYDAFITTIGGANTEDI